MASVTVKRVWKEYGQHVVIENLNLVIKDHEFVTIVGASGCGKTTFLRMLLGMESPSKGEILIDDTPLIAEPGADRGIVFQRYSLFPHLTALDNLLLAADFAGATQRSTRTRPLWRDRHLRHSTKKQRSDTSRHQLPNGCFPAVTVRHVRFGLRPLRKKRHQVPLTI